MNAKRFTVGGERQPVIEYMRSFGFVASIWSDKVWFRHDGKEVRIFGAGSMARMGDNEFPLDELGERLAGKAMP